MEKPDISTSFFDLLKQGEEIKIIHQPVSCLLGPLRKNEVTIRKEGNEFIGYWNSFSEISFERKTLFRTKTITKSKKTQNVKKLDERCIQLLKEIEQSLDLTFSTSYTIFEFYYNLHSKEKRIDKIVNIFELLP